jgi:hypothetical protein
MYIYRKPLPEAPLGISLYYSQVSQHYFAFVSYEYHPIGPEFKSWNSWEAENAAKSWWDAEADQQRVVFEFLLGRAHVA